MATPIIHFGIRVVCWLCLPTHAHPLTDGTVAQDSSQIGSGLVSEDRNYKTSHYFSWHVLKRYVNLCNPADILLLFCYITHSHPIDWYILVHCPIDYWFKTSITVLEFGSQLFSKWLNSWLWIYFGRILSSALLEPQHMISFCFQSISFLKAWISPLDRCLLKIRVSLVHHVNREGSLWNLKYDLAQ